MVLVQSFICQLFFLAAISRNTLGFTFTASTMTPGEGTSFHVCWLSDANAPKKYRRLTYMFILHKDSNVKQRTKQTIYMPKYLTKQIAMAKFKLLHKPIKRDHSRSLMQQVTNELPPLHTSVGSFSCLLYAMLTTKDENTKSICQQFKRTEKWCNVLVTKTSSTNNKKLS